MKKALLLGVVVLNGCARLFTPLGDTQFNCNRMQNPDSPYCHSFRSVDTGTDGVIPDSRYDQRFDIEEAYKLNGIASKEGDHGALTPQEKAAIARGVLPHQIATNEIVPGAPVREGPVVQRIWVKPWVDSADRLNGEQTIYQEIRGNRWTGYPAAKGSEARSRTTPYKPSETVRDDDKPPASQQEASPAQTSDAAVQPSSQPVTQPLNDAAMPR